MALLSPEQRRAVAWAQYEGKESPEQQGEFLTAQVILCFLTQNLKPELGAVWPLTPAQGDPWSRRVCRQRVNF
jgi:hypothetical protein